MESLLFLVFFFFYLGRESFEENYFYWPYWLIFFFLLPKDVFESKFAMSNFVFFGPIREWGLTLFDIVNPLRPFSKQLWFSKASWFPRSLFINFCNGRSHPNSALISLIQLIPAQGNFQGTHVGYNHSNEFSFKSYF